MNEELEFGTTEEMERADHCSEKYTRLGGSLSVANVQALAASQTYSEIPPRYIRPELKTQPISNGIHDDEIPVIDLIKLLDSQFSQDEAMKLNFACEEWGFFQLINHGVPEELIEKMKADIEGFFMLPLKEKEAYAQSSDSVEGYGQIFVVSEDQKLDWADMFFLHTQPIGLRNMKLWPTNPPTFKNTLDSYLTVLKSVVNCLLGIMSKNLGLEPESLDRIFTDCVCSVRMNYYPPCPRADEVIGLSPHSDATGLTLLLQINEVQGLQIKKNGRWVGIKPLKGAFIANIGDMLEIITNGKYKSIEHRAIINPELERLSIAAFHNPSLSSLIGPLPELVKGGKECFTTVSHEDYIKMYISNKLEGKNTLDQMKLNS